MKSDSIREIYKGMAIHVRYDDGYNGYVVSIDGETEEGVSRTPEAALEKAHKAVREIEKLMKEDEIDNDMKRVCAWCGADMGTKPGPEGAVTHGMCADCVKKVERETDEELARQKTTRERYNEGATRGKIAYGAMNQSDAGELREELARLGGEIRKGHFSQKAKDLARQIRMLTGEDYLTIYTNAERDWSTLEAVA